MNAAVFTDTLRRLVLLTLACAAALGLPFSYCVFASDSPSVPIASAPTAQTNNAGFRTNGPAVFQLWSVATTTVSTNQRYLPPSEKLLRTLSNNASPEALERFKKVRAAQSQFVTNVYYTTNGAFVGYVPESLSYQIWTNVLARTNHRTERIWSERRHPILWPMQAPAMRWDTNGLLYGMRGFTGLSPCWQLEGAPGQVPVTLLTRRHGYTRGHGMGEDGMKKAFLGKKVWFLTSENEVIERKVTRAVTRTTVRGDYTILMLNEDVPASIAPLRVVNYAHLLAYYPWPPMAPYVIFMTEQEGNVNAGLPGFNHAFMKGGDSGSPNMLPFFGELVFFSGRSTSGPSAAMQEDIDALCKAEKSDPTRYQLQWLDLSRYPKYGQ